MDLLLDVNIVLDICQPRPAFADAALRAISRCRRAGGQLWLYAGSVQTLQYTLAYGLMSDARVAGRTLSAAEAQRRARALLQAFASDTCWLAALAGEGDVWQSADPEDEQLIRALARFAPGRARLLSRDQSLLARHPHLAVSPEQFCAMPIDPPRLPFVDLGAQQHALRPALEAGLHRTLHHGQYILGPEVAELESALARFVGVRHCIGVASGTEALLIALMSLDIGPGDEVITTPFSFAATAEVIVLVGATPVFVDVEPDTGLIDARLIEARITPRTKALMPVSLYGQCADMDAIGAIAARHDLAVIEDAAQSFGATYRGRRSGGLCTWGATSFFPSKPLGCYGDGGALFTDDDALAQAAREIRVHGQSARYAHTRIGVGGRLDTIQAAVLLAKLERFDDELQRRRELGVRYAERLADLPAVRLLAVRPERDCVWAQYTVFVDRREAVQAALQARGIPTAVHYPKPLHHQPAYARCASPCPVAERIAAQVLSLPMSADLSHDDQDRVVAALREAVGAA